MSSERKDEFLSWRGRLDSPEGIPGQGLDHPEETWERLMDRFRGRPRRRLPVYAIVAASLFIAVIAGSHLFLHRIRVTRTEAQIRAVPPVAPPEEGPEVFTSITPAIPSTPAGVRIARPGTAAPKRTGRGGQGAGAGMSLKTVAVSNDTVHTPGAPDVELLSQSLPSVSVPQKKWKVVDLNELDAGWQPPHSTAANFLPGSLHIGPGKPDRVPAGGQAPEKPALRFSFSP